MFEPLEAQKFNLSIRGKFWAGVGRATRAGAPRPTKALCPSRAGLPALLPPRVVCRHLHPSSIHRASDSLHLRPPILPLPFAVRARIPISLLAAMGAGVLDDDDFSDFEQQLESFRDFDKRRENFFTVSSPAPSPLPRAS